MFAAPAQAGVQVAGPEPYPSYAAGAQVPSGPAHVEVEVRDTESACGAGRRVRGCYHRNGLIVLEPGIGETRRVFLHELGHAYDAQVLSDAERAAYAALIGRAGEPWRGGENPPLEHFAESYYSCAIGLFEQPDPADFRYSYAETAERRARVCEWLKSTQRYRPACTVKRKVHVHRHRHRGGKVHRHRHVHRTRTCRQVAL